MGFSKKYTREQKMEVAVLYMMWGNQTKVSKITGVDNRIISHWVNHDKEFKSLYEEAIERSKIKFDAMTSSLLDQSLELVDKKVKLEMQLVKQGEGKMSPKDAALTSKILFEMRQLSRSLPTSITERKSVDHLKELADQFQQITDGKKAPKEQPTEEVVH